MTINKNLLKTALLTLTNSRKLYCKKKKQTKKNRKLVSITKRLVYVECTDGTEGMLHSARIS